MTAEALASTAWPALAARIAQVLGLDFTGMRARDLRHAVASLAPQLGIEGAEACAEYLVVEPWSRELQRRLAEHLTVGESYFFRDPALLDVFASRLLPDLIARRREAGDQRLRIWSAGCSGGEEPYTLAILLRRLLPDIDYWDVSILATDVNPRALAKARAARFSPWSFRGVEPQVRDRWFERAADGGWRISPVVQRMVRFEEHNLAQPLDGGGLGYRIAVDAIFCRNVLMYFDAPHARDAIARLAGALVEGGWLAVSPSEACGLAFPGLQAVNFQQGIVFRKSSVREPLPRPVPLPELAPLSDVPVHELPLHESVRPVQALLPQVQADAPAFADSVPGPLAANQPTASEMAIRLADAGLLEEALAWCDRWLEEDRMDARGHYLRGLVLMERGDRAAARESLRRCLYLDHGFAAAQVALAELGATPSQAPSTR